jgi:hypothetical protein
MKVIPPLTITNSILSSSTTAEPGAGESAWVASTNYALGAIVIRATTHKTYQNVAAGVDAGLPENTPLRWLETGVTNRWAMFDLLRNTQTVAASPLTITLVPLVRVNAMALIGLDADTATITMTVGGNVVYTITKNLVQRQTSSWSTYFFGAFLTKSAIALFDLPMFSNATITIMLTSSTGTVKCGSCAIGRATYIGAVEYNAESDALNFSLVERDQFGNSTLVPRRSIPKTTQSLWLDKNLVNSVRLLRESLNAVPAIYSGLDDDSDGYFDALLICGIYKQFTINLGYPTEAKIALQLEEI